VGERPKSPPPTAAAAYRSAQSVAGRQLSCQLPTSFSSFLAAVERCRRSVESNRKAQLAKKPGQNLKARAQ